MLPIKPGKTVKCAAESRISLIKVVISKSMPLAFFHVTQHSSAVTQQSFIVTQYKPFRIKPRNPFEICYRPTLYYNWIINICDLRIIDLYVKFLNPPMLEDVGSNISNTQDSVSSGCSNTEKRVENTTRSGVFLIELFGQPMRPCLECLIYLLNGN